MNKIIKGSIAGAAGIALLLGGAGTFALWNDSASLSVGSITAGDLSITQPTGKWYAGTVAPANEVDVATYRVVPGSVLIYKSTVTVSAVGNALKATLKYSGGVATGALMAKATAPLTVTFHNGPDVSLVNDTAVDITNITGSSTADVSITFTVANGAAGDENAVKKATAAISPILFTLTQKP